MTTYLTAERLASLKQYLTDMAGGIDTVTAWNAHKARMADATEVSAHECEGRYSRIANGLKTARDL
jgi:hypothetical protein